LYVTSPGEWENPSEIKSATAEAVNATFFNYEDEFKGLLSPQ